MIEDQVREILEKAKNIPFHKRWDSEFSRAWLKLTCPEISHLHTYLRIAIKWGKWPASFTLPTISLGPR